MTRFYNSPRKVRVDGERMTRPGSRESVWIREEETGDVVLRDGDGDGVEHARFPDEDAVFQDADAYPSGGERTIMAPILPAQFLEEDTEAPAETVEILAVPTPPEEDATLSLADLELVVDADGHAIPATLDVSGRPAELLRVLREHGAPVTRMEAQALAADADPDLDRTYQAVSGWINDLREAGLLADAGTDEDGVDQFRVASD